MLLQRPENFYFPKKLCGEVQMKLAAPPSAPIKRFIIGGATNSFGAGGYDISLIRTDSLGKKIWSKTYGGTSDEGTTDYLFNFSVDFILTPDFLSTKSYGAVAMMFIYWSRQMEM